MPAMTNEAAITSLRAAASFNKIGRANRRPASPFEAGRQFGRASCAPPFLPAAVAHLCRSAALPHVTTKPMQPLKATITAAAIAIATSAFGQCTNGVSSIDFDDLGDQGSSLRFAPSNHYAGRGVIFSRDIPFSNVCGAGWPCSFWATRGGTTPNFMNLPGPPAAREIEMRFVVPGTTIPATTDYVAALLGDSNVGTTNGTLEAFDADGSLLAAQSGITPAGQTNRLEIHTNGIARVRLSVDSDGGVVDNIVFTCPTNAGPYMTIEVSEVRVCWTSNTDTTYRVEYRSDLTTNNWTTLTNCVPSAGSETCITDKLLRGESQRYYRAVVTNCVPGL
jgi:hypothetical protein